MEFCFILLQLFAHVQEIILQQNDIGVAFVQLRLSLMCMESYLLSYLPTNNLSRHYVGDVDMMCSSSFAYFRACGNSPTRVCKIVAAFILFNCT